MPRYDFKCACGHVRPDVWVSMFRDAGKERFLKADISPCEVCGGELVRQFPAPAFSIKGFNAKNGYSK